MGAVCQPTYGGEVPGQDHSASVGRPLILPGTTPVVRSISPRPTPGCFATLLADLELGSDLGNQET
jgi:hypothetical protein